MFATENRAYRKSLASHGLLYLGQEEHEILVLNLSITGVLTLLKVKPSFAGIKDIFRVLQVSPIVDFYLPEINLAGEAEVVRAESVDAGFQIAIEFRNLTYDVDSLLYRRRAYRKSISAAGHIVFNETDYAFNTENVSIDGIMIRMLGRIEVEEGTVVSFDFQELEEEGEAKVVWVEYDDISTLIGLQYLHLRRGEIVGVPKFSQPIWKSA
ncbi:PilZ domain-containing protein [Methylomonas sp. EFPC3]|uniref:PilZ domain-containing protein n=1 Tax=Methylomonas sp. EFPC3 TaxID=3021710 RepID=UPI002416AE63|nr:PilZ domain-containing protein [Methylomonas sp. EFPC3]WFP49550.1 PilZ domain-containing protein [Methylomonas sp. EFPC3]